MCMVFKGAHMRANIVIDDQLMRTVHTDKLARRLGNEPLALGNAILSG